MARDERGVRRRRTTALLLPLRLPAFRRLWAALGRRASTAVIVASHLDEDVAHATSVHRFEARAR